MNFKYSTVIFDLDGTLLDTSEGILEAVKYTINKYNLKALDNDKLLTFIGPPIQESFSRYYNLDKDKVQEISNVFRDRYSNFELFKAKPYKGIYEVLRCLLDNNVCLAVSTYKREDYALKLLKYYQFDKYFKVMHGGDNLNKYNKKDIIQHSINEIGEVNNSKIVYVGDTESDFNASKELRIDFIGVNYGFGFNNDKEYINSPSELISKMR